jgi:hypothetical protein
MNEVPFATIHAAIDPKSAADFFREHSVPRIAFPAHKAGDVCYYFVSRCNKEEYCVYVLRLCGSKLRIEATHLRPYANASGALKAARALAKGREVRMGRPRIQAGPVRRATACLRLDLRLPEGMSDEEAERLLRALLPGYTRGVSIETHFEWVKK